MGPSVQRGAAPHVHSCADTLLATVVGVLYSGSGLFGGNGGRVALSTGMQAVGGYCGDGGNATAGLLTSLALARKSMRTMVWTTSMRVVPSRSSVRL